MTDSRILASALYHYYTEQQRAGGRVDRGNGKQHYISLCTGLWGDLSSSVLCLYLKGSKEVRETQNGDNNQRI